MIENAIPSIARQPRREAVDPVGEVDHVHQPDQPDHGHHAAGVGELQRADERDRDVCHDGAGLDRDHRRGHLPDQLHQGRQVEHVVERADERDQHRAADRPACPRCCPCRPGARVRGRWIGAASRSPRRSAPPRGSRGRRAAGVARAASPRSRGTSTAPIDRANLAANGVNTAAIAPRDQEGEHGVPVIHWSVKHASPTGPHAARPSEGMSDGGAGAQRRVQRVAVGDRRHAIVQSTPALIGELRPGRSAAAMIFADLDEVLDAEPARRQRRRADP